MLEHEATGVPPVQKLRRILIDCAHVDFSRQPTGIPRVVLKYIEIGYTWGQRLGIEVVPVVPSADGLKIYRPVPGRGAPAGLLSAAQVSAPVKVVKSDAGAATVGELRMLAAELRGVLHDLRAVAGGSGFTARPGTQAESPGYMPLPATTAEAEPAPGLPLTRTVDIKCAPGDMIFCPGYWHDVDPVLYREYAAAGAKIAILVHDILPITFSRFYNAPWCYDFKRSVLAAFGFADVFCTVSDSTRLGLAELGLRERMRDVPMVTTYNGYEPLVSDAALKQRAGPRHLPDSPALETVRGLERYYVMVGSIEPKKGHVPVIMCFESMWRAGFASDLVIIGRRGWLEENSVRAIEDSPFYKSKLFWFSGLDDFELGQVYEGARALVFASAGEGFGIPMIESAAHGTPIIALDSPIVQEILGPAARVFTTATGFLERIVEMEQDTPYGAAVAAAKAVAWPSWEVYTPRVLNALRDFFEGGTPLPEKVPVSVGTPARTDQAA